MKTVEALNQEFQEGIIPLKSKKKYEKEWKNYEVFCFTRQIPIDFVSIKAYVAHLHSGESTSYSESTIITQVSMLKKMNIVKEAGIPLTAWASLKAFTEKCEKPCA